MKIQRVIAAFTMAAVFFSASSLPAAASSVIEHTFLVSQMNMTHLCKETPVTLVNEKLPGPVIEVNEGDSVVVHVINKSPSNITIHWHGLKQWLNCWADGVPMVTQLPILPNNNFTYRLSVTGQEGTLWWHAHVPGLRGTLHGAFVIRPRHGASSYPFPRPHEEIPIIIGDWWQMDLALLDKHFKKEIVDDLPVAATINGKLGDTYNCSGVVEDGYVLDVEPGKTYLLRIINAVLFSEYYLKIAGHNFTVVGADANYVKPYTTDVIAIAPGETVDALIFTNASLGEYYMVALPNQAPLPDPQIPVFVTRGMVRYKHDHGHVKEEKGALSNNVPLMPEMPDQHDTMTSFYFRGNLTSLGQPQGSRVPAQADESMFITLGLGSFCPHGRNCENWRNASIGAATMNNVSFQFPSDMAAPLINDHYCHCNSTSSGRGGVELYSLPDKPPRPFNYTDPALAKWDTRSLLLERTVRATVVRRFRYGAVVDVVFQSTSLLQSDANPMHLHGHDMFVLAQGHGNYDAARDVARYNLVDPPMRNTVMVPRIGWVAIRFVADNPGVWFMHCHYEFHLMMGMAAVFIIEDGPTPDSVLPPPPDNHPNCNNLNCHMENELYLRDNEATTPA